MEKKYEIALSYAHKDEEIAEMIQVELENIFADSFFMDELHPEELAAAVEFKKQLQVGTKKRIVDADVMGYDWNLLGKGFIGKDGRTRSKVSENIAEYLRNKMQQCSEDCGAHGGYTMHVFPDTTASLMFALGARTIVPGGMTLYEYNPDKNSYDKSLTK